MAGHPIFAAVYDKLLAANEEAGLRDMRAELLGSARGRTLEIGAGTGLNLAHYPEAVTELVLTEPDPHMAKRLRRTLETASPPVASVQVIEAGAEEWLRPAALSANRCPNFADLACRPQVEPKNVEFDH